MQNVNSMDWFLLRTACGCERRVEGVPLGFTYTVLLPSFSGVDGKYEEGDVNIRERTFKRTMEKQADGQFVVVYEECLE